MNTGWVDVRRTLVLAGLMALVALGLLWRVFSLQILQGQQWVARAEENYTQEISIQPARGIIYDRNGVVLARNVAAYNVVVTPANLPDDDADIERIYRELSALIDVPVNNGTIEDAKKVAECVPGPGIRQLVDLGASLAPYQPVKVSCDVSEAIARAVMERAIDWPGVSVEIQPIRDYPTGELTAAVVGFLGPIPAALADDYEARGFVANRDKVGYAGVEAYYDDILLGTPGRRLVERDVAGKIIQDLEPPQPAIPGNNLVLTIDTRLQFAARAALLNEIEYWNTYFGTVRISSGVVIAMNPKTGEILAMVTYPTYENNRMARFIPAYYYAQLSEDPRHPLLNNAISGEFPPGSVFKLSTALGAINEGVVTPNQIIETPGKLTLVEKFSPNDPGKERDFVDWIYEQNGVINPGGFGQLDFYHCIAYSSNVCFYKLGGGFKDEIPQGLDILRLAEYARALGYDQPTGIDLPGEQDGLIPTPRWKRINLGENWSTGDTYIASVGQGYVLATPLQVLMSAATIANDGVQMRPHVLREVVDGEGNLVQRIEPEVRWDITKDNLIRDYVCEDGYCEDTGNFKNVSPWAIEQVQQGMRYAVTDPKGTLHKVFGDYPIAVAGKTGTAEYCDDVALKNNRCQFGAWPTHSWTVAYAPYDDPEIVVVAFAYNGGEGASVAAPIVSEVVKAYFELRNVDAGVNPAP
jgi:penicillin-binding protein 2